MDYSILNAAIAQIKELENRGLYGEGLVQYQALLQLDPDRDQSVVIQAGRAVTFQWMNQPEMSLAALNGVSFDDVDQICAAVAHNVRSSAHHKLNQFREALEEATRARRCAESAPIVDPEVASEAIANEGFALASLGFIKEAILRFDLAESMQPDQDTAKSIELFRTYCFEQFQSDPDDDRHN